MPFGFGDGISGGATGRITAGLRRLSRRAQVGNNRRHAPTDLRRGEWPVLILPGQAIGRHQVAREGELIMHGADHDRPQLGPFGVPQLGVQPEQALLVKP